MELIIMLIVISIITYSLIVNQTTGSMNKDSKPFIESKIKGNIKDNSNAPPKPKSPPPKQPKKNFIIK